LTNQLAIRADASSGSEGAPEIPRRFVAYTLVTLIVAVGATVALAHSWTVNDPELFWILALFVLVGELMPIPVPHRHGLAKVTISTTFAFAILLRFGAAPATLIYVLALLIADTAARITAIKVVFNAAQYALSMLASVAVLAAAHVPLLNSMPAHELPVVLLAALAFFAVNHLLACAGGALLAGLSIGRYLVDDLPFQAWTAGCLLGFAPAVLAAGDTSVALVPVAFLPALAIYVGGRQAAVNSHRAYHDALTELPNRLLLTERLQATLEAAGHEGRSLSVLLLDLDDFKAINDTLGHEFGDLVLAQVAQRLQRVSAGAGMLARLGGDEFALIHDGDQEEAEQLARRLVSALDRPLEIDSLALHVAGSIGIACFPAHGRTAPELLRHADVALYCAKASDAAFESYAEEQDEYSIDRLALAAQLRRGLERGELVVHYQPKVPLHGGVTSAVEALVRWNHPQLGRIGPDGFIPLAEQTGIIKPLTEHVLEGALRQCERWRAAGLEITVSVNVSTRSLLDYDLAQTIRGVLQRFDLPASVLQLEITESRIVADLRRARATLEELRAMGVMIAIDDFGTGFSSLSQLQQLPIDEIKIDRSFVSGMESDRNDAVLVRSIIELGRNLGLRVTAEGVETEEIRVSLCELGCDFAQGFHVGRPVPAEECERYLGRGEEPAAVPLALARGSRS
jgi:diguanylate cyclase (GGDEF)-like protein